MYFEEEGYEDEGAKEYRKANKRAQKTLKKAKEDWGFQGQGIKERGERGRQSNNSHE